MALLLQFGLLALQECLLDLQDAHCSEFAWQHTVVVPVHLHVFVDSLELACYRVGVFLVRQISRDFLHTRVIGILSVLVLLALTHEDLFLLPCVRLFLQFILKRGHRPVLGFEHGQKAFQLSLLGFGLVGSVFLLLQVVLGLLEFLLLLRIADGLPGEGNTYAPLLLGVAVVDDECGLRSRLSDDRLVDQWRQSTVLTTITIFDDGDQVDLLRLQNLHVRSIQAL